MSASCPRCGSAKVIPDVPLFDRYGESGAFKAPSEIRVHGEPEAWFFKDTSTGELRADICGECGHAEIRVNNFRELYEKYEKSREG